MTKTFDATSTADDVLAGTDLKGKRYLVTGVSSGIGRETARALMTRGAAVVGTVKDSAASEGGQMQLVQLDLASLQNVRACADVLLADGRPFDAVIANAGVMATPFGKTVDGFETQFAINYLGHFALIERIASLLRPGSRVVALSSQAHRVADVDLLDSQFERQAYDPFVAYGRSKTAVTLYAAEFDRRHRAQGIRAASVMPGNSLTELPRNFTPEQLQGLFATVARARADSGLPPGQLKEIGQAAATSVWAAVVADASAIGGRYLEDCAVAPVNDTPNPFADGVRSYALDPVKGGQLWRLSEEWTAAQGAHA